MRVRVNIDHERFRLNETFDGKSADDVVAKLKARVAKDLPFALRLAVNAMSPLTFAQEIVKRYNESKSAAVAPPKSCAEFIDMAVALGMAMVEQA